MPDMTTCPPMRLDHSEALADELFTGRVRDLVADRFGFAPRDAAMGHFTSVVRQRRAARPRDEYWRLLVDSKLPDGELQGLVEDVLNHDTVCGRTPPHFEALRRHVLPSLGHTGRPVRLASLGCSTGEEAYSLALTALEVLGPDHPVEVVGLDLSRRALQSARAGVYPVFNLRELSAEQRRRGFVDAGTGCRVRPEVARMVRFAPHNLMQPLPLVGVDAVFCRNVLIYFSPAAANRVLGHIRDALTPGGWLFLGHAESALHQRSWFEPISFFEALAYRRRQS